MKKSDEQIIKEVIIKAKKWILTCNCEYGTSNQRHCENYGCTDLHELIKPLENIVKF